MKTIRVAVYPSGTEIGLEIGRQLAHVKGVQLVGLNSAADYSEIVYLELELGAPTVYDAELESYLVKVCAEKKIEVLIPAHDEAIRRLASFGALKKSVTILGLDAATAETLRFKSKTYRALEGVLPIPEIYDRGSLPPGKPLFVKPDVGQGSVGAVAARDSAHAEAILSQTVSPQSMLILENLPGDEYTIDCFSSLQSEVLFSSARRRARISKGISTRSESVSVPEFDTYAKGISQRLKLKGPWFYQMKTRADGSFALLEVAARIAGSSSHSRALGFNFMEAALFQHLGYELVAVKNNYSVVSERALSTDFIVDLNYETVYVDFDDTITKGDGLFGELIGFLFEAKKIGKKLVLITRHAGDIHLSLRNSFLSELFDEVVHLKASEPKSASIDSSVLSIFIDDSFRERLEVSQMKGIPVFSLDMIDVLRASLRHARRS